MPGCSDSLVTAIKPEAKYLLVYAIKALFHSLKKNCLYNRCVFLEDLSPYVISGP
jgi:hypothetical protein